MAWEWRMAAYLASQQSDTAASDQLISDPKLIDLKPQYHFAGLQDRQPFAIPMPSTKPPAPDSTMGKTDLTARSQEYQQAQPHHYQALRPQGLIMMRLCLLIFL